MIGIAPSDSRAVKELDMLRRRVVELEQVSSLSLITLHSPVVRRTNFSPLLCGSLIAWVIGVRGEGAGLCGVQAHGGSL